MTEKRLAVLFPGQGSQYVGMLPDLDPGLLARADERLGRPLGSVCASGPKEVLDDTVNAQPAVFIADMSHWQRLRPHLANSPDFAAGHSLGEYAAYVAAGALDFDTGLLLVARRAELMAAAAAEFRGGMVAVIGLPVSEVSRVLEEAGRPATVANYNSPVQAVVSGTEEGLRDATRALLEAGAKKTVPLAVSGPFHSPLMKEAADAFATDIAGVAFREPEFQVVANVLGRPAADMGELKDSLRRQIYGSVLWHQSVEWMSVNGVSVFVEVGPGKVVAGLVRRIVPEAAVFSTHDYDDPASLAREIATSLGG